MSKDTTSTLKLHSNHALLALIGHKCQKDSLLAPLHQELKIQQKTLVHSPTDKLQDCLLAIMQGAEAVSQVNTCLKSDPALSLAFGRQSCADQSSIQQTLSACDGTNVAQMQTALRLIFQTHSQTSRHNYQKGPLILDIDITGLPCGRKLEGAAKGYFAGTKPGTTGRQLYRVSASQYDEIVYQKVCPGNIGSAQLSVFKEVVAASWQVLKLSDTAKSQVLIRLDSGYGTSEIINYLLSEGYQFVTKMFATLRAKKLDRAVSEAAWHSDPCHQGRSASVLTAEAASFYSLPEGGGPLQQIGVRCHLGPKSLAERVKQAALKAAKTGKAPVSDEYQYSVLVISTALVADWASNAEAEVAVSTAQLLEQVHFYDQRATIESASFRGDKQGLKIGKRRKQSMAGQEMLILLAHLAHNLIVWARGWLSETAPKLADYGIKRWVRDLLTMPARLTFKGNVLVKVRLSRHHQLARQFFVPLAAFFSQIGVRLFLCEI